MIIVTDHHHLGDLEKKVVEPYCDKEEIRCIGDLSVHQKTAKEISLCKEAQKVYREEKGLPKEAELTLEEKRKVAHKNIKPTEKETFKKWKVYYGATPIYNLVRKTFIGETIKKKGKKGSKFIGLMSHEKLLNHIQEEITHKLRHVGDKNYIRNVLNTMEKYNEHMATTTYNQLNDIGIDKPRKFILDTLKIGNFGGNIPSAENVFADFPKHKYFHFERDLSWEMLDKTMVIYVPLFERHDDLIVASRHISEIKGYHAKQKPDATIIAYHGNPHAAGIGLKRVDHNIELILPLVMQVHDLTAADVNIFCGHLHKSAEPYKWNFLDKKNAIIHPIDVDEMYIINTNNPSKKPIKKNINTEYKKLKN